MNEYNFERAEKWGDNFDKDILRIFNDIGLNARPIEVNSNGVWYVLKQL